LAFPVFSALPAGLAAAAGAGARATTGASAGPAWLRAPGHEMAATVNAPTGNAATLARDRPSRGSLLVLIALGAVVGVKSRRNAKTPAPEGTGVSLSE